ncbi:MAG: hypothetical protein IKT03_04790, partial [Muribaculaceae bacterium]|nr:hypothetical protein [Muribaculaceae bacterium]
MSNTLNEYISKIKRCFKAHVINDELASNYLITGKRGESYKINLNPELKGLNVTIPYKEKVIPYLDSITPEARAIGAVNVIKVTHSGKDT